MPKVVAECYFLDVGQGTCQVINLGGGSAVVIDCGRSYQVLGDLLRRRLRVKRIEALILSHNHSDHTGGLPGLVRQYRKSIGRIYLLQDQPAGRMQGMRQFSFLREEFQDGNIPAPIPLIRSGENRWLFSSSDSADSVRLELLFPTFFDNIDGQAAGNQNYTCGVMRLQCGNKRVLFPGDAEIDAWRSINEARDERPVECDVMAIPHHGGQIVRYRKKKNETYGELHEAIAADLEWLYTKAIKSDTAIVSVGTSNSYPDQHPLPPQIDAVKKSGACVMCTQITGRCSDGLERLRPGVLDPGTMPCQSRPTTTTSAGQSRDVACAGTVVVQIGPDEIRVERQTEHRNAIDSKLTTSADHPLCRSS